MTQENMDDFSSLKRNSKNSLSAYQEEAKKLNSSGFEEDTRFWTMTPDKAGNGRAIIRFLSPAKGEKTPFVKYFTHGFSIGGSWYIENCPTSLGEGNDCPACEHNSLLWKESGDNENHPNRAIVRSRKRRLHYVSNIYIVKDYGNPENNGKVFLFKYGKKIFEKIQLAMNPKFDDETPINPFDFWDGANFDLKQKLVIEGKNKYPNFDDSKWDSTSPLADTDEKIKEIWLSSHLLQPIVAPENFKSYDVLKKHHDRVLGKKLTENKTTNGSSALPWDDEEEIDSKTSKPVRTTNPEDFFKELVEDDD